jgi:hypothetical protein
MVFVCVFQVEPNHMKCHAIQELNDEIEIVCIS